MNMMDHIRKSMNKDKTVVQEQVNPAVQEQVSDAPISTVNDKILARINEAKSLMEVSGSVKRARQDVDILTKRFGYEPVKDKRDERTYRHPKTGHVINVNKIGDISHYNNDGSDVKHFGSGDLSVHLNKIHGVKEETKEQPPTIKHETPIKPEMKTTSSRVVPVNNTTKLNITAMADYIHRHASPLKTEQLQSVSNQEKVKLGGKTSVDMQPVTQNVSPKDVEPIQMKNNKVKTSPNTEKENGEVDSENLSNGKKKKRKVVDEGIGAGIVAGLKAAGKIAAYQASQETIGSTATDLATHAIGAGIKGAKGDVKLGGRKVSANKVSKVSNISKGLAPPPHGGLTPPPHGIIGGYLAGKKMGQRMAAKGARFHPPGHYKSLVQQTVAKTAQKGNQSTTTIQKPLTPSSQVSTQARKANQPALKKSSTPIQKMAKQTVAQTQKKSQNPVAPIAQAVNKGTAGGLPPPGGHMSGAAYRKYAGLPPAGAKPNKPSSNLNAATSSLNAATSSLTKNNKKPKNPMAIEHALTKVLSVVKRLNEKQNEE